MNDVLLLIVVVLVTLIYLPLNKRKAKYYWESRFDKHIPVVSIFIVPYALLFPYLLASAYFSFGTYLYHSFMYSFLLATVSAEVFWYLFPNGVKRLELKPVGLNRLLNRVYKFDADANGFPSGHVYQSIICTFFMFQLAAWPITWLLLILGFLVAISTVFTKQHYIIDVFGGILWAILSIIGGMYLGGLLG